MEARILSWESKRKAKSRRRLDRTEVCSIRLHLKLRILQYFNSISFLTILNSNLNLKIDTHLLDLQSEVEKTRLKALEKFRSEVVDINEIAEGARSKAMENRRNEELKAKDKANKIRVTGKVPTACFCF